MHVSGPRLLTLVAVLVGLAGLPGCSRRLDPQQYGEILEDVPKNLNQPYPLPKLEGPPSEGKKPSE